LWAAAAYSGGSGGQKAAQAANSRELSMRTAVIVVMALSLTTLCAFAQGRRTIDPNAPKPTIGMGSKTMDSCTADKQKVCPNATEYMTKECLVKNWDHISSDCQDALGTPFDGAGHGGAR
jgi:hypothetical protein